MGVVRTRGVGHAHTVADRGRRGDAIIAAGKDAETHFAAGRAEFEAGIAGDLTVDAADVFGKASHHAPVAGCSAHGIRAVEHQTVLAHFDGYFGPLQALLANSKREGKNARLLIKAVGATAPLQMRKNGLGNHRGICHSDHLPKRLPRF